MVEVNLGTIDRPGRRYGGIEADQRRAERRARLIKAALDLFGSVGYQATPVKLVCERASLTQRYFYESFRDREQLLQAVYDEQIAMVKASMYEAVISAGDDVQEQIRAGFGAVIGALLGDSRRARIVLVEVVGVSTFLESHRRGVMHQFVDFIVSIASQEFPDDMPSRFEIAAMTMVGGITEILVDQTLGYRSATLEELVDVTSTMAIGGYLALR